MVSWVLEDDCLAPEAKVKIDYRGPDPFKFYHKLKPLCRGIFEVESKDYWEKEFRFDNTGEMHGFEIKVFIKRALDAFSTIYVEIYIQGDQPADPTKDGWMRVEVGAKLRTESPYDTWIQRSSFYKAMRYFYFKVFYSDVRRGYLKMCRWNYLEKFIKAVRENLGISGPTELGEVTPGTVESLVE